MRTPIIVAIIVALPVLAAAAAAIPKPATYDSNVGGYAISSGGATGYIFQSPTGSVNLPPDSVAVFDLDTDPGAGLWIHIDLGANYNDPLTSTAGPSGGGTPTAPPPKPKPPKTPPKRPPRRPRPRGGARVVVESVAVEVWPGRAEACAVYGTAGRLLLWEHFRARLVVRAEVEGGGGAPVAARLNVTIPQAPWYAFSRWPGPRLGNESYSASLLINSSGVHVYWLPLNCSESWRGVELGEWVFAVQYAWSNGAEGGSGEASAMVLVDGSGGANGTGGTSVELYWLPVAPDTGYIVVFYRWSDGGLVLNRSYLGGQVAGPDLDFSVGLRGGLWRSIAGNFTRYADVSGVLGFEPPGDAAVSYAAVHTWDIRVAGLGVNATYRCLFPEKFPDATVRVAELSTPVYALNWTSERVWGRLKLVDWARVAPVEGWVVLLVDESGGARHVWLPATPFAEFDIRVEEPYEVWAIPVAPGRGTIYLNDKYRVLLVKQPP